MAMNSMMANMQAMERWTTIDDDERQATMNNVDDEHHVYALMLCSFLHLSNEGLRNLSIYFLHLSSTMSARAWDSENKSEVLQYTILYYILHYNILHYTIHDILYYTMAVSYTHLTLPTICSV